MHPLIQKLLRTPLQELPAKIANYYKYRIGKRPEFILLQTVSACNLQCSHCFINNYGKEIPDGKIRILPLAEFHARLPSLRKAIECAKTMELSSFEALLHKDLFVMMDTLLEINPRLRFALHSNGLLLDAAKLAELEKRPISEITISLDGCTAATVEAFKTGSQFAKVVEAIQRVGRSTLAPVLGTVFVMHRDNMHELPATVDFVADLGAKAIFVNNLLSFTAQHHALVLSGPQGNPAAEAILEKAILRAQARGLRILIPSMTPIAQGCDQHEMLYIDIDGRVPPCDFLGVSTPFHMHNQTVQRPPLFFGNIANTDALAIYQSPAATAFRQTHRSGKLPPQCSHCADGYGILCSKRKVYEP